MIHYTCDMCGKPLLADEDTRYVVKVEVYAAYDPMEITDADLAEDKSEEVQELLEQMADMDAEQLEDQVHKTFRFDLCLACQARYVQDPLSRGASRRVPFGNN
ncbi:MAG TPA: hypothetical protein VFH53_05395 [Phycisphaerae bacterium]|nr:hypothetical protein [Phycisphaerae bacterium]